MAQTFSFTIPGEPMSQERARKGVYGNWYQPSSKEQQRIGMLALVEARKARVFFKEKVQVEIFFYQASKRRRDIDNQIKLVLDSCNTILWTDDSNIESIFAKRISVEPAQAKTIVTVFDS